MHINPAAYLCCNNVIKDKTCQLSNSLWTGNQPELPSGQLINLSQDPTNCCFDHFLRHFSTYDKSWNPCKQCPDCSRQACTLRWELDSRVGIVHFWLHVRLRDLKQTLHDVPTCEDPPGSLEAHKSDGTIGNSRPELVSDWLLSFSASLDWSNSSQALQMNDVNIWTWVQYCLL